MTKLASPFSPDDADTSNVAPPTRTDTSAATSASGRVPVSAMTASAVSVAVPDNWKVVMPAVPFRPA